MEKKKKKKKKKKKIELLNLAEINSKKPACIIQIFFFSEFCHPNLGGGVYINKYCV